MLACRVECDHRLQRLLLESTFWITGASGMEDSDGVELTGYHMDEGGLQCHVQHFWIQCLLEVCVTVNDFRIKSDTVHKQAGHEDGWMDGFKYLPASSFLLN